MLQLFKPKNRSILGIDISSNGIKAIEISGNDSLRTVEGYGIVSLPPDSVDGHGIKDAEVVANALKQLLSRFHLEGKAAVVSVPDAAVITRVIQVNDGLTDAEIEEIILMEADKYIPYPIEEINLDFEVIGPSPKKVDMLDTLIVASRSENVNSRVEALTKAGLEVKIVDVESYAIERSIQLLAPKFPAEGQGKIIAVIDIGTFFSNLFVLHEMKLIFTREEDFGGKQLTDEITHIYNISAQEALIKEEDGTLPEDYHERVLMPYVETLVIHVKRALQFFFSTSHYSYVDYILLAGGVAKIPNLANLVEEKMNIPTSIANPFEFLSLSKKVLSTGLNQNAPVLLTACGLALREVD